MKKSLAVFAMFLCAAALFAFAACGDGVSEQGEWELSFFGDGEQNYAVGDEYAGSVVTERFYTCSFDGAQYILRQNETVVCSGRYTVQAAGEGSLRLALAMNGETAYWNCGVSRQANGTETLAVTGAWNGLVLSFVPAG